MIASALLPFRSGATLWTIGEVLAVFGILKEFFIILLGTLLAALTFVPSQPTFETHLKATGTRRGFVALALLLNVRETARLWAPFELGIEVNDDVLVELKILGVDLLRSKLADIFPFVYIRATEFHARDLQHTPFYDLYL